MSQLLVIAMFFTSPQSIGMEFNRTKKTLEDRLEKLDLLRKVGKNRNLASGGTSKRSHFEFAIPFVLDTAGGEGEFHLGRAGGAHVNTSTRGFNVERDDEGTQLLASRIVLADVRTSHPGLLICDDLFRCLCSCRNPTATHSVD